MPSERPSPRDTSLLALAALDRYVKSDLVLPGDQLHNVLAVRLVKVARGNKW